MPPVTRKRSAPVPTEEEMSSDDEHSTVVKVPRLTSTDKRKEHKCPWNECEKVFSILETLRCHYRTHTKEKPYKCTFGSCDKATANISDIFKHIRNVHHQQQSDAKKYVKVNREMLAKERKLFGIRKFFTGEIMSDGDTPVNQPTLPPFTTIQRTSTGHYICPFSECDNKSPDIAILKRHYRVHCGTDYRPFKCNITDYCQYASAFKAAVVSHIRTKHNSQFENNSEDADELDENNILTNADLLEMEDALFSNAQIVGPPELQRPQRPQLYACTFDNCKKKFSFLNNFRYHFRTHTQAKPFFCSFSNCDYTAKTKANVLHHIHSSHFDISYENQKNRSNEEKEKAEEYVGVKQDVLDEEEAQIDIVRIGPKRKHRKRSRPSANQSEHDIPDYTQVGFDDDSTEDEDDKDELTSLLAANKPTTSSN